MPIAKFVGVRVALGVLTLLVVSVLVFLLTGALGDPAAAVLGRDAQQPALLAAKRAELGLDRGLAARYWDWFSSILAGDLGASYTTERPIAAELAPRIENSLVLMVAGAAIAIPVSILVGAHAALRRDGVFDRAANAVALVLAAVPEFVLGMLLVVVFSIGLFEWLPAVSSVRGDTRPWHDLDGLILPSITLALIAVPYLVRSIRASMLDVLESEYVEAARLNGLSARTILWRHALPNAAGPTLQVVALGLAFMTGGVVVVEAVFNYPGIGTTLVDAITTHDVPVVQAIALFVAALYIGCNTLADICGVLLTPRLRTGLR